MVHLSQVVPGCRRSNRAARDRDELRMGAWLVAAWGRPECMGAVDAIGVVPGGFRCQPTWTGRTRSSKPLSWQDCRQRGRSICLVRGNQQANAAMGVSSLREVGACLSKVGRKQQADNRGGASGLEYGQERCINEVGLRTIA